MTAAAAPAVCVRDDCPTVAGRNGIGCHQHFTQLVPPFLARAFFAERDQFTKAWLRRQVAHAIREEEFTR